MTEKIEHFDFENLFVFDLANNHQGSVEHGKAIIAACAEAAKRHGVRAAIKFQFRDLPEFVHKDERASPKNKHVPRFLSTRLEWAQFGELLAEIRRHDLLAMCTPFDEASVDRIVAMSFDIMKVASCSARDWPLLERIAGSALPVVFSTGGLEQSDIDDLVSFFGHKACEFAMMHCVSIYPTPDEACHLANIAEFRERYPGVTIGWSTHEPPAEMLHVGLAYALGARMFERHVGLETDTIKLNAYSSTPAQVDAWLAAWVRARAVVGQRKRQPALEVERRSIDELRRGVFARVPVAAGEALSMENVYFAFPYREGQLSSGEWKPGLTAPSDIAPDAPVPAAAAGTLADPDAIVIKKAIHEVKALLAYARVPLSSEFTTEYSHHYGIRHFRKFGAVLITIVNREYAKKILVQLPGQMHPWHFHKLKEETFVVLSGELVMEVENKKKLLVPGDILTVLPGVWHRFWTETGSVFEEISTTAHKSDSTYRDPEINKLTSAQRKTVVDHWGRFQLTEQLRAGALPTGG